MRTALTIAGSDPSGGAGTSQTVNLEPNTKTVRVRAVDEVGNLAGWTSDRYMPRIRTAYGNDPSKVPFDFYEVVAALAPRSAMADRYRATVWSDAGRALRPRSSQNSRKSRQPDAYALIVAADFEREA